MSSLPTNSQAIIGDGAGSTASPQRGGAFNRFAIGSPARLPIPQDGSPSSAGAAPHLESQLAVQSAQLQQLLEIVKALTQNVAEMEKKEPVQLPQVQLPQVPLPQAQDGVSQTCGEDAFRNAKKDYWQAKKEDHAERTASAGDTAGAAAAAAWHPGAQPGGAASLS